MAATLTSSCSAPALEEPPDELRFSSDVSSAAADRDLLVLAPLDVCCLCGYGRAGRFFGRGGGMSSCCPSFSSFRKNFCAWLRICATDMATVAGLLLPRLLSAVKGLVGVVGEVYLLDAARSDMVDDLLPVATVLIEGLQETLMLLLPPRFPCLQANKSERPNGRGVGGRGGGRRREGFTERSNTERVTLAQSPKLLRGGDRASLVDGAEALTHLAHYVRLPNAILSWRSAHPSSHASGARLCETFSR